MARTYRDGAIGALLDEHERAAGELLRVLEPLDDQAFCVIRDAVTSDETCRSIQTIVAHVLRSGYGYANYIRAAFGMAQSSPEMLSVERAEVASEMPRMLAYLASTLDGRWRMTDAEIMLVRMVARHGPTYDLEQLLEHAIVHILRHRRQIERFLGR
jgi:uncharacterized damage-inducible protein DinB